MSWEELTDEELLTAVAAAREATTRAAAVADAITAYAMSRINHDTLAAAAGCHRRALYQMRTRAGWRAKG